jgi:uncharacterized membrane protein
MERRVIIWVLLLLALVSFVIAVLDPGLLDIKWEPTGLGFWVASQLVAATV